MQKEEIMLKVENVSKVYKLGEIGGTTLRDELQRLKAKILHREDPTKRIGAKGYNKGERFKALDNISFKVKKGERIGIIGHNGAGKSTLLKLISRVTGPSDGKIYLNGRVASMLEVGTGFHPELTGRENIYMNGAILGMTKKEIDAKIEDIIEFSEVRQFIDTPVKRYSSGMYVKLAFSVAAHLDSEIMIMDEVLAVGDMSFQKKCIKKMRSVSLENEKTILYVSHNMNTILDLCNRVIVLNEGQIVFDGNPNDGVGEYLKIHRPNKINKYVPNNHHPSKKPTISIECCELFCDTSPLYHTNESITGIIKLLNESDEIPNCGVRFEILNASNNPIAASFSNNFKLKSGGNSLTFKFKLSLLTPGRYVANIVLYNFDGFGGHKMLDAVYPGFSFDVVSDKNSKTSLFHWRPQYFGNFQMDDIEIVIAK